MIKNINVRFFVVDYEQGEPELLEVQEREFLDYHGEISYSRATIFNNGVRQIILTKGLES